MGVALDAEVIERVRAALGAADMDEEAVTAVCDRLPDRCAVDPSSTECAGMFLDALCSTLDGVVDRAVATKAVDDAAEAWICSGAECDPGGDIVRVVQLAVLMTFYTRTYTASDPETDDRVEAAVPNVIRLLRTARPTTVQDAQETLNDVLDLTGRLRWWSRPLWVTTSSAVEDCRTLQAFADKLTLWQDEGTLKPALRLDIPGEHVGSIPNVAEDENAVMSLHVPTPVDALFQDAFKPGGRTEGGAAEYVTRLDNAQAIAGYEVFDV